MLKYLDTRSGNIVEMAEPHDIEDAAEEAATERARSGSKKGKAEAELISEAGSKQAAHARRTLARMDESDRWVRAVDEATDEDDPGTKGVDTTTGPAAAPGKPKTAAKKITQR